MGIYTSFRTSSIWIGFMYKLLFIIDVICVFLSNKVSGSFQDINELYM